MKTKNIIGGRRDILNNVLGGTPINERRELKKAYKNLRREGYINLHGRKKGEDYISLIPSKILEIIKLLEYNSCRECGEFLEDLEFCDYCKKSIKSQ